MDLPEVEKEGFVTLRKPPVFELVAATVLRTVAVSFSNPTYL